MSNQTTCVESMWIEAVRDTLRAKHQPSRNGGTREIIGWSRTVMHPLDNWVSNERRALSREYAAAELLWYLLRTDEVKWLLPYAPQYEKFGESNGRAFGAYGYRLAMNIRGADMLNLAVAKLKRLPDTRQCVISLWRPNDLEYMGMKNDLPCTLTWQFILRDGMLHMIVSMRSNDVWLGLPYDVYVNTCIQTLAANTLGVDVGTYTHHVGSLHLYDKNISAAVESMQAHIPWHPDRKVEDVWKTETLEEGEKAAQAWKWMQQGTWCPKCPSKYGPLLERTLRDAAKKFGHT